MFSTRSKGATDGSTISRFCRSSASHYEPGQGRLNTTPYAHLDPVTRLTCSKYMTPGTVILAVILLFLVSIALVEFAEWVCGRRLIKRRQALKLFGDKGAQQPVPGTSEDCSMETYGSDFDDDEFDKLIP